MRQVFNITILALCLGILAPALSSCQKDKGGNKNEDTQTEAYPYDDAELLLNKVLCVDKDGTILGTRGGLQLNEGDPGKVTIIAEDFSEAKSWFEFLIPEEAEVIENGGSVIWNLQDSLGVKKGQAVLKPVSDAGDGRIAELEVPVSCRPLSAIAFIPRSAMPLNDDELNDRESCDALDPYYLGARITLKKGTPLPSGTTLFDSGFMRGEGEFVVIQEYLVANKDGILLRLEPGEQNWASFYTDTDKHFSRASAWWTLIYVHDIIKASPSIVSNFKDMGMPDWNNYFLCMKNNYDDNPYRYHLKNGGSVQRLGWFFYETKYYEAFVYRFYVRKTSGGEYRVYMDAADWGYNDHH